MPFCANCGSSLKEAGTLCDSCGTGAPQTSGAHPEYATAGGEAVASATAISSTASAGLSNNLLGLLCYLLPPLAGIVLLVMEPYKNDRFVRFHAFQSIFSCIAWIAMWIVWGILSAVFGTLSGGLIALITLPIDLILGFAGLAYWIFLMYKAYSSQTIHVPFIGSLAEQQANK